MDHTQLCRIEKRAIEVSAVAPFIAAVSERLGRKAALEIVEKVNQQEAFQRGRDLFERLGQAGIDELAEDVATWGEGGSWEMVVLEKTSTTYFFNVVRCPYYEKYKELGLEAYGVAFSCCRDEPFARGLNPRFKLERSRTIMEGAEYCDFRYYLQP